eukprot:jgi/Antlo1/1639/156
MQMQSVVMTTKEQVVVEITETLEILFSTISYLRNFFPSSYFATKSIDTVEAKILTPACPNSSLFISWYKVSVKDAFQKRYLRKLVLAVYLDEASPEKVSETYTLEFSYDKETQNSIFQMIRTLSLLTQTLEPLPPRKFITLKLFYNEKTPYDYEPEGFKASTNHQFLFETEPLKLDLNSFRVEQGCATAFISSLFDKNARRASSQVPVSQQSACNSQLLASTQGMHSAPSEYFSQKTECNSVSSTNRSIAASVLNVHQDMDIRGPQADAHYMGDSKAAYMGYDETALRDACSKDAYSQRCIKEVVPACRLQKKSSVSQKEEHEDTPGVQKKAAAQKNKISSLNAQLRPKAKRDEVRCICNINISDSDMLYCDMCNSWLHTVCCGFFTNTDRRIPTGKYVCILCTEKDAKSLYLYRNLAIFRRTLSIIYNENLESVSWLSQRIGISHNYARNTVNRLVNEGFVLRRKVKNGMAYEIIKTQDAKEKIKEYFTLGLKKFKSSVPIKDVKCE